MSKYHIYYLLKEQSLTYKRSLFTSFPGQFLVAFIISFGESGRGSVCKAVICHYGNMWVGDCVCYCNFDH